MRTTNTTRMVDHNPLRSFPVYLLLVILGSSTLHARSASELGGAAGEDNVILVCSSAQPFVMIDSLLGSPQPGGVWINSGGTPHGPIFMPDLHLEGTYCYVLGSDTACLSITVTTAPNAGSNGFLSICGDTIPDLSFPDGGDTTGYWVNCGQNIHCYVVTGAGACPNDTAVVTINLVAPPNAGIDNMISVCPDMPPFIMIDSLIGEPDPWGNWSSLGIPFNGIFIPSSSAAGTYVYAVPGMSPCAADVAYLTITILLSNDPECLSTGIADPDIALAVSTRPNPNTGVFSVGFPAQSSRGELEVHDLSGRLVLHAYIPTWSKEHLVDLRGVSAGMYQCSLRWGTQAAGTRVVVE